MKQILNNISRITLSIMREGLGVGLLLITLLMMAMSPQNVWAEEVDIATNVTIDDEWKPEFQNGAVTVKFPTTDVNEKGGDVYPDGPLTISVAEGYIITKVELEKGFGSFYELNSDGSISINGDNATITGLSCQKLDITAYSVRIKRVKVTYEAKTTSCDHQLTAHPAVDATCTTVGNSAYWSCSKCDKYFSDNEGKNEVAASTVVKPTTNHNFVNGTCTQCGAAVPQFTYKATSDLSSTFQSKFGSYGTVTCGTWTDANTPVTVTVNGTVTSIGNYAFFSCSALTSITIPEGVTSIGNYAFHSCSNLTSITIPEGVTSISNHAFEQCSNLTSITIPEGVTSIGESTFDTCKGLTSITLPSSVTSIDNYAFWYCENLTTLTVLSSNATLSSNALGGCSGLQTIYVPENRVATYKAATNWSDYATKIKAIPPTLPFDLAITKAGATEATLSKESVKTITINKSAAGAAQVKAQSGTEVVTPTQLEHNTRYDFTITKVPTLNPGEDDLEGDIVAKVKRRTTAQVQEPTLNGPTLVIGTATAYTTYPLDAEHTSIKLEMAANGNYKINGTEVQGVTSIYFVDAHVFTSETESETYQKTAATCTTDAVYYHKCAGCDASSENNTNSTWTKAGSALGHNVENNVCTVCGTKQTKITYTASEKLTETTVSWSSGFHTNAFGGYTYTHVFDENTHIGTITFDGEVTSIGDNAFYYCQNLTSITIPSSVTSIGIGAFSGCYVTSSNLHNSSSIDLTQYGLTIVDTEQADGLLIKDNCAVKCRPGATSVNIPGSVTSIGKYAFSHCSNLASVTFTTPSSVTSIGEYAFGDCTNLASITIPSGVTSIGDKVFYWCSNLTSITIPSSVTSIGQEAFVLCSNLATITIPSSVTSIGENAFYACTNLTSVICKGATPASLGDWVFYDDEVILSNLKIYVPVGSVDTYKAATNWSDYASKINAIPAASVTTSAGAITFYETFEAALAATVDGSTIRLNEDVTITKKEYNVNAISFAENTYPTNGLTIDLGQKTLTIQNISDGGDFAAINIQKGNNVVITNGKLDIDNYETGIVNLQQLTLNGVTVDGTHNYVRLDIEEEEIKSGLVIFSDNSSDVVLDNSTITAPSGEDCYAYYNNPQVDGNNSLTLTGTTKMDGNIDLHNCTLKAASTTTIANCTLYVDGESVGALSIANGTFTAPTDYKWTAGNDGLYTLSQHTPVLGDLNGDDNITITDLTLLIQLLNQGGTITNKAADVNKDGSVTVADVEKLRDKVLGIVSPLTEGVFSVSATKKVQFTKGNLWCNASISPVGFAFETNQYDISNSATYTSSHVYHFFWTTDAANSYVKTYSDGTTTADDVPFFAESKGGLTVAGTEGLYALSMSEWMYLINEGNESSGRSQTNRFAHAKVNGTNGLLIFPDGYEEGTAVSGVTGIATVNTCDAGYPESSIAAETWSTMEANGVVFLPAAGSWDGVWMNGKNSVGAYWSSTPSDANKGCFCGFGGDNLCTYQTFARSTAFSLRLVKTAE